MLANTDFSVQLKKDCHFLKKKILFVCVEVLRLSPPIGGHVERCQFTLPHFTEQA